jgi:hypothetical protein
MGIDAMAGKRSKPGRKSKADKPVCPDGSRFEPRRLADYGDAAILEEIRRVAALVDRPFITASGFEARSRVAAQTVRRRFGGWREALERAGLGHRYGGRGEEERARAEATRRKSDAELLEILRATARVTGGDCVRARDVRRLGGPEVGTFANRFGSWARAVAAAGLRHARRGRWYGDEQCFDNLLAVWSALGRAPTAREMDAPPSTIGWANYARRFGSWRKALAAFAERVNGARAGAGDAALNRRLARDPLPARPLSPVRARKPSGRIGAALRHQVLARDRYKCAACGLSPAIYQFCTLDVDHIVPVALGGRTELANLRTLCSLCNAGKGARPEPGPAPGDPALPPPAPGLPE